MIVPRFRSRNRNSLRPVNRIKHVFDEQGGITAGAAVTIDICTAVDAPVIANTQEVETGCTINGFFIVAEINATSSAALANAYFIIGKNPGGSIPLPNANAVGSDKDKKYVIHQEMVMLQQVTNSNPRTLFKGVVAVPRGYRRMGPSDRFQIQIRTPGVALNYCIQVHYKEFR